VHRAELVGRDFDARRAATGRTYRYLVWNAPEPDPLLASMTWHVRDRLDLVPEATDARGAGGEGRLLRFEIAAGSFCHQMVRSLVSSLVEVGRGRESAARHMERAAAP